MLRNAVWLTLLLIVALFGLWFIIGAGYSLYSYYQFSLRVPTTLEKWSVKEVKSDKFAVIAHYSFEYENKNYHATGQVGDFYPNPWAAKRAEEQLTHEKWPAWINPNNPNQSVLEKKFPYKKVISAAVLIGLFIYFFILSSYIKVKSG
jgi:hypothetical protein